MAAIGAGVSDMSETIKSRSKGFRPLGLTGAIVIATSVGFMISAPAGASDVSVRGASCTLVRYYVARYSVPAAEAWARSKGATEVEIDKARRCIHTAQVGRMDPAF